MEGNPATVYLPFPAKRTGRSEGRGKVLLAEVTLHESAPDDEEVEGGDEDKETVEEEEAEEKDGEGEDKAEEAVKEEEEDEGPAIKKFKTTWLAFYREYV